MAANTNARLVFNLQDLAGLKGSLSMPMKIDGAQTVTACASAWNTQGGLLDKVTGCQILSGEVVINPEITFTPKGTDPEADAQIERTGNLDFLYGVRNKVYDSIIPGISTHVLNATLNQINEAQTDMANYIVALGSAILGGTFTTNEFLAFVADPNGLKSSFVSFRKHRKRLHEVSYRTP
jgi:hypothetical protein